MPMISRILMSGLLFLALAARAEVVTLSNEAHGTGDSRDEAVLVALENAVGKAFGFEMTGKLQRHATELSTYTSEGDSEILISRASREIARTTHTPANKPIVGYEVLDVHKSDLSWIARVKLFYRTHKKLGVDDNRRGIVVYAESKNAVPLAERVEVSLVATRRFNVLKRDDIYAFDSERSFVLGADADPGEVARLGSGAGADYLVLVRTGDHYNRNYPVHVIRSTGERISRSDAGLSYEIEVVEFSSREIKWRRQGTVSVETNGARSDAVRDLANKLELLATAVVTNLTEAIYPARVAQVHGNSAVLNRGEGAIDLGQVVRIYSIGDELTDPQSGEALGFLETEVAKGKVVELKPKYSIISVTEGRLNEGREYIVRWNEPKERLIETSLPGDAGFATPEMRKKLKAIDDAFLNY